MRLASLAGALGALLLLQAPLARAGDILEEYGQTELYTVVRTSNHTCLAMRSIEHEFADGEVARAYFAFGFGIIQGEMLTLASILSPTYDMPKASWRKGELGIDGETHPVAFVADGKNLLSAYAPANLMFAMFKGYKLEFLLPNMTETIMLKGTSDARQLLGRCASDLAVADSGDNGKGSRSVNPLAREPDERGQLQSLR
jgi:hypothetical protein